MTLASAPLHLNFQHCQPPKVLWHSWRVRCLWTGKSVPDCCNLTDEGKKIFHSKWKDLKTSHAATGIHDKGITLQVGSFCRLRKKGKHANLNEVQEINQENMAPLVNDHRSKPSDHNGVEIHPSSSFMPSCCIGWTISWRCNGTGWCWDCQCKCTFDTFAHRLLLP